MSRCGHESFLGSVAVARLSHEEDGPITGFMADVRIECAQCGRPFQFLGLPAGLNTQGATVSVDGLEARLGICPEGEEPSPLDCISAHVGHTGRTH